ncbi:ABC transporter permease [Nocardioides sp. SYSU DS0651]|uniref:ABC transporter permease n=1 Tax=Nocardioides sp. SYSU DS0651 TaxID=3415955 RepID=UPI003F4B9A6D
MTATTLEARATAAAPARPAPSPIPFRRVVGVELRKMFDTRSGFWLMASILILSVVATGATIIFADREDLDFEAFASAVGIPMSVILPMIGVLSVTSEWSQRTALTTFTLVPSRGRVVVAKLLNVLAIGAVAILVAAVVGAIGNVVVSAIVDKDAVWNISVAELSRIVLANEVGMLMGFVLGLLIRSSPGAIVGYFVYALVLPGISSALASTQDWWSDNAPWFDLNFATSRLFEDVAMSGEAWAQLGTAALIWMVVPGLLGIRLMMRSEIK